MHLTIHPEGNMDFGYSARTHELQGRLALSWTSTSIRPRGVTRTRSRPTRGRQALDPAADDRGAQAEGARRGLWNLFLPDSRTWRWPVEPGVRAAGRDHGAGALGSEVFNCSAPDTGNMETIERYGTPSNKQRWLEPLLDGKIRSALRDDRAGRSLRPTPPTSQAPHRARGRRLRDQRPQVVDLRRRRSALQGLHLHGQDRSGRAPTNRSSR